MKIKYSVDWWESLPPGLSDVFLLNLQLLFLPTHPPKDRYLPVAEVKGRVEKVKGELKRGEKKRGNNILW